jgi:PKD repeat protein
MRALVLSLGVLAAMLAVVPGAQATPTVTLQQSAATVPVGQGVTFGATATTDDGAEITSLAWAFGDGQAGSGASVTHAYGAPGTYSVTVTATDANGRTAGATGSVRVVGTLSAAFTFAPATPSIGGAVAFDASASDDPGGAVSAYRWKFGDGSNGTGAKPSHTYTTGGDKTVTLQVATADGRTATVSHALHVNTPPTAGFDVAPAAPLTGDAVTFTSTASDADGGADLASISWDLNGDGTYGDASGPRATAVFLAAGRYTVGQRVTDMAGAAATVTRSFDVAGPPAPPPVVPPAGTEKGQAVAVVPAPGAPVLPAVSMPALDAAPAAPAASAASTGAPAAVALKLLRVRIQLAGTVKTTRTRITRLLVFAPQGAMVAARCSGRRQGCPASGLRQKVRKAGHVRLATMERSLRVGARIVVSVGKAGFATRRIVLTMRDGKAPARSETCLLTTGAGAAKEGRCPAA